MARLADPVLAERRRRQIMEAAMACFRKRGFHQASMQEICATAGISAGALYRYFPSKADIIFAISEEEHQVADDLIGSIARGGDITEVLVALARGIVARCAEDQALTAEILAEAMRSPVIAERFGEKLREKQSQLAVAIEAGQRRGTVERGVDADTAARMVMLMIDGLILRATAIGGDDGEALTAAFRVFVERLLKPSLSSAARTEARVAVTES